jgi:hypothetical protein
MFEKKKGGVEEEGGEKKHNNKNRSKCETCDAKENDRILLRWIRSIPDAQVELLL